MAGEAQRDHPWNPELVLSASEIDMSLLRSVAASAPGKFEDRAGSYRSRSSA